MSWWNSVLNVVKEVATDVISRPGLDSGLSGVCSAAQFQNPIYARTSNEIIAVSASAAHQIEGDGIEGTSQATAGIRITTRARTTYELDRFQKNAMLMFVQIQNNLNEGRNKDSTNHDVSELVETFSNFRFEVDVHIDLTCRQVEQNCLEYFQRDFSQYGAVVVMVLTYDGTNGQLSALDGRFSESIILRHLTDDLNPTLLAKPKIYVTEANRTGESNTLGRYSLPLEERHQDILGLHIPYVYSEINGKLRPLLHLCRSMRDMGNSRDFVSIVKKTIEEATKTISVFNELPMELSINLSKDMMLARSS